MSELIPTSEDSRVYEICVLLPYPLSQKEEQDALKAVESVLADAKGKQITKDVWGRRGLAFAIGGYTEGNYAIYHYELTPETIDEVDESLRLTKNVLRHLIVKPPKGYQIVEYSKKYEEWLKDQEKEVENSKKAREEELRQKMIEKQKRQPAKKASSATKTPKASEKTAQNVTEEIDKLIADDELEL